MKEDLSHLGGTALEGDPMTFVPDVWQYLLDRYHIESVVDVGCGVGINARWFQQKGLRIAGVEGFPDYLKNTVIPGFVIAHDYTKGPVQWPTPGYRFDLGWSSEFVEHVEEKYVPNFMETFKLCKYVCLTHATPGQGGYHHVNEQPGDYWITRMQDAGFKHLLEDSAWMQATGPRTHYGRRTLMLFQNVALPQ